LGSSGCPAVAEIKTCSVQINKNNKKYTVKYIDESGKMSFLSHLPKFIGKLFQKKAQKVVTKYFIYSFKFLSRKGNIVVSTKST